VTDSDRFRFDPLLTPLTVINGVTAPERNASVPRSRAEIAVDVVRCLAAGAAIVHSHARRCC